MARFDRGRHDTFVETRRMLVARRWGLPPVPCRVVIEIDVGVIIGWMATRALSNKSHSARYLNNALRIFVRPEEEEDGRQNSA